MTTKGTYCANELYITSPHTHFSFRGDCWCTDDQEIEIKESSVVRLRILGITVEAGAIVSDISSYDDCIVICFNAPGASECYRNNQRRLLGNLRIKATQPWSGF